MDAKLPAEPGKRADDTTLASTAETSQRSTSVTKQAPPTTAPDDDESDWEELDGKRVPWQ
jgi:hypothetical protein